MSSPTVAATAITPAATPLSTPCAERARAAPSASTGSAPTPVASAVPVAIAGSRSASFIHGTPYDAPSGAVIGSQLAGAGYVDWPHR